MIGSVDVISLDDVPNVLGCVAEFAAGDTGTEGVVADTDGIVLELVRECVVALGHGTDEDTDALLRAKVLDVIPYSYDRCVE